MLGCRSRIRTRSKATGCGAGPPKGSVDSGPCPGTLRGHDPWVIGAVHLDRILINRARHSGAQYASADHHWSTHCYGLSGLLGWGGPGLVRMRPVGKLPDLDCDQCNNAYVYVKA
jgi:hypothetical protein